MHRRFVHGEPGQLDSKVNATLALAALAVSTAQLEAQRTSLDALDAEIGDGDHGTSLASGFARGYKETSSGLLLNPATGPGAVFLAFGQRLLEFAGGASGVLTPRCS